MKSVFIYFVKRKACSTPNVEYVINTMKVQSIKWLRWGKRKPENSFSLFIYFIGKKLNVDFV